MSADTTAPLDRDGILVLVRDQLAEILEKSPSDIAEDVSFEDLGADSLALIELVEALEENLATYSAGFHIDDEDFEGLASVRDAVNYVALKLQVVLTRPVSLMTPSLDTVAERLGLDPASPLLVTALTHSSFAAEHDVDSNERLEFLGDAVVDLAVADLIITRYPDLDEGSGSLVRSRVVNEAALARAARHSISARFFAWVGA